MFARTADARYARAVLESADLVIRSPHHGARIRVGGCIDSTCAAPFAEALCRDVLTLAGDAPFNGSAPDGTERVELELDDLELCDGAAVAEAVNALRTLSIQVPLVVWHAPQMLAHTLYKAGLLDSRLRLEAIRDEVGTAG
jgi:hypothetical protein